MSPSVDKVARAGSQHRDRLPSGTGHADRKARRAGAAVAVDAGQPHCLEQPRRQRWKRRPARSPRAPPSSRCRAMCWPRATSSSRPIFPKRTLDAAAKLSLGSYDRIALQMPGNPLGPGARRHRHRAEQFDADGAAVRQYGRLVAVHDRCRRLVRPRSLRAGRAGDGRVRDGMADETVRQRGRGRREEIERDALERRAVRARRDVGGRARAGSRRGKF